MSRKLFCRQPTCPLHVFTERLPGLAAPWARRTRRLAARLLAKRLALGGAAGVRPAAHSRKMWNAYVAEWLGEDNILFPSDYPHWDSAFPEAVNELMARQDVSDQLKRKIFYDNPQRLYGFTVDSADFKAPETAAVGP